ncbi:unnamed protein product [Prunus brigantina]
MEKQSRLIGSRILKLLSKAAQPAVTYHSPPPSPRKTPGPMISLIPSEARRKPRNGITFGPKEPTSPKVSCMGQIKGKQKKKKKKKNQSKSKSNTSKRACPPPQETTTCNLVSCVPKEVKKKTSKGLPKEAPPKEGDENDNNNPDGLVGGSSRGPERVPSLGQMRRFASGRGVLADFDLILEVHDDQLGDVKNRVDGDSQEGD